MTDDLSEPADVHWAQMIGLLIIILLLFLILLVATRDPPLT
jgi:flagellar biogenesis protein FliO